MGHLAKQRDASFFRVFFNPYHYGVLTVPLSGWGEILHNPAAAETILDRLVYKSHIIKIAGKSYRLKSVTNHKAPS